MSTTLSGSCLCGAVAYRLTSTPRQFYYCECVQCRKLTGSVAATNLAMTPAPITWTTGAADVVRYDAANGRAFSHVFCRHCGSGLPFLNRAGNTLIVPAGSLDTPPPLAVQERIFAAERPAWASFDAHLPESSAFSNRQSR